MSSQYSPDLRIELIGTGDQAGVWGATTNNNMAYVLEQAIAGYVSVAVDTTHQALTYLNGASATAGLNQSVHAAIALTAGAVSANFTIYAPPNSKLYVISNTTTYTATITNSDSIGSTTPSGGSTVTIPANKVMTVWSDGYNFIVQNSHIIGTVAGNVTGNVTGNLTGNVTGNVTGNLTGSVTGNVTGDVTGNVTGNLTGNVTGNVTGNLTGNVTGNVSGSSGSTSSVVTANYSIVQSGSTLYIRYGSTDILSIDSSGNLTVLANLTAYGTP